MFELIKHAYALASKNGTLANSVEPDEKPQNGATWFAFLLISSRHAQIQRGVGQGYRSGSSEKSQSYQASIQYRAIISTPAKHH